MGKLDKLERQMERFDWVPQQRGLRFIVVNKETGEVVNDCNGYGFKSSEAADKWIEYMQQQVGIIKDQRHDPNIKTYIRILRSLGYTVIPPKKHKED